MKKVKTLCVCSQELQRSAYCLSPVPNWSGWSNNKWGSTEHCTRARHNWCKLSLTIIPSAGEGDSTGPDGLAALLWDF
ncbi:hypothetical protein BaRGS_00005085 [Batillaria attramentaria]|uniref:Uncharacterized protein n=1 Tax=Batillaria attramentaria TaxID=370345 RepID=A0ABD0LVN2_9CAEN